MLALILLLTFRGLFGWWTATVALRKNRGYNRWFWTGFALGWVGVLIVYCTPKITLKV